MSASDAACGAPVIATKIVATSARWSSAGAKTIPSASPEPKNREFVGPVFGKVHHRDREERGECHHGRQPPEHGNGGPDHDVDGEERCDAEIGARAAVAEERDIERAVRQTENENA